jgi:16S rRNA (uracil1498-N3)-methyltransferase
VAPRGEGPAFGEKVRARMLAALEQSGGAWLPEIHPESELEEVATALPDVVRLVLDRAADPILGAPFGSAVALLVGPEGGMEPSELERLIAGGWRRSSLGTTTLRFETAALAATAVARAALSLNAEG